MILDTRIELEQIITKDLRHLKRKLSSQASWKSISHARGGVIDINLYNEQIHISLEVTQILF